jgi:membrane-associated phospholipid phosphatase
LAGSALITWWIPPPQEALWTRPFLFDEDARRSLRSKSRRGRAVAGAISDVSLLLSTDQPLLIDPVLVAGVGHDSWDVAWQMHVIGAQSYAFTLLANSLGKRIFARQRPYAVACAKDPDYSSSCESSDRFRSFYSGHSAFTAAGAGLVCAHHTHVPLYGGDFRDTGTCLASVGLTLLTGAMRITADRHWATDVLVGHVIGFTTGFLIPSLIYYDGLRAQPVEYAQAQQTEQAGRASLPFFIAWCKPNRLSL